jgi:hypothetical protein
MAYQIHTPIPPIISTMMTIPNHGPSISFHLPSFAAEQDDRFSFIPGIKEIVMILIPSVRISREPLFRTVFGVPLSGNERSCRNASVTG